MKKYLLPILFIITLIILVIYIFMYPPRPCPTVETIVKHDTIYIEKDTGLADLRSCNECLTETAGETFTHFKDVVNNYRIKIWDVRNNSSDFANTHTTGKRYADLVQGNLYNSSDSRTIWFPMEIVKKFICTIESYNKKLNAPKQQLGIRFYYAVYGPDHRTKPNQHTLFMVPTFADGSNGNVDYDPRETYKKQNSPHSQNKETISLVSFRRNASQEELMNTRLLILSADSRTIPSALANPTAVSATRMDAVQQADLQLMQNTGELCPKNCPTPNTLGEID